MMQLLSTIFATLALPIRDWRLDINYVENASNHVAKSPFLGVSRQFYREK
jgi:hypothetical protein